MAGLISFGLTQAGVERRINEDSFQSQGRIYPDTLDARECHFASSQDFWQIYAVSDGIGGPGIGDISTRFVQGCLRDLSNDFPMLDPENFRFSPYIQHFVDQADKGLRQRLRRYEDRPVGCSLALLMFSGNAAYCMSIGSCRIYACRQGKIYQMTRDHLLDSDPEGRPLLFFGNHPGALHLKAQNLSMMPIEEGDRFLLMTDGMSQVLQERALGAAMNGKVPFEDKLLALFEHGHSIDASDNQTLLGIEVNTRRASMREEERGRQTVRQPIERPQQAGTRPGRVKPSGDTLDREATRRLPETPRRSHARPAMETTRRVPDLGKSREDYSRQAFDTLRHIGGLTDTRQLPPQDEMPFYFDPGPGTEQDLSLHENGNFFPTVLEILREHAAVVLLFTLAFFVLLLLFILI